MIARESQPSELEALAGVSWDALVIGAGPAGASAAHGLARAGVRVLLCDEKSFPRWKVCGACLNAHAMAQLDQRGLAARIRAAARPLRGLDLEAGGAQLRVPLSGAFSLSRAALDLSLVEAAVEAGAHFRQGTRVRLAQATSSGDSGWRTLVLKSGQHSIRVRARVVLAAGGLGFNPVGDDSVRGAAVRIGAGTMLEHCELADDGIHMAVGSAGYVGWVRIEDGRWNVAAALDPRLVRQRGLAAAAVSILRECGPDSAALDRAGIERADWRGTPILSRSPARLAAWRVLLLGDAAGYVEPFTGEGIAWALDSGAAVTPLALRAIEAWEPELAHAWEDTHRRRVRHRQRACRVLAQLLRHPRLTAGLLSTCARLPRLATPLIAALSRRIARPSAPLSSSAISSRGAP